MSRRNATRRFSLGSHPLSVRRRVLSTGGANAVLGTTGYGTVRPTQAVIVGEDAAAGTGLLAVMRARYPGLPVSLCQDVKVVHRLAACSPGCLVIAVLCLRPAGVMTRLRELLWLRRHTRQHSWLLLYDGLCKALPERLSGMDIMSLHAPISGIQRTLDGIMHRHPPVAVRLWPLTSRQWAVLRLLARGCRPSEVARRLGIAEKTVSAHRTDALCRLGLSRHHERLLFCAVRVLSFAHARTDK